MPRYTDPEKRVRSYHKIDLDPELGRTLQEYLSVFGLNVEDLRGKKILDLGAGKAALPAQELQGIAEVVSLSPDFVTAEHRQELETAVGRVAALGETLPFNDGTFDMVWLLHVADHLDGYSRDETPSPQTKVIVEAVRVLHPGGIVYIAPAHAVWKRGLEKVFDKAIIKIEQEDTGFAAIETNYDINYDEEVEIERMKITKL